VHPLLLHLSCTPPVPLLQVRVFRVFKMGKSFAGLQLMVSALRASRQVRWAPSAPSPPSLRLLWFPLHSLHFYLAPLRPCASASLHHRASAP
jgi:hypothetical protein